MGSSRGADCAVIRRALEAPPPGPDQVALLVRRWRDRGDIAARNALVCGHVRIPAIHAIRLSRYGPAASDVFAEGCIGLVRATDLFDPERGVRFSTYADYWVRSYAVKYTLRCRTVVPGSTALSCKTFFRVRRELARARAARLSPDDVVAAVAERLGIPPRRAAEWAVRVEARDVSLDAPLRGDEPGTLLDVLGSPEPSAERLYARKERSERVGQVLDSVWHGLDERERAIVSERLMASRAERATLEELGLRFGVTRQRIQQVERDLVGRLRSLVSAELPNA